MPPIVALDRLKSQLLTSGLQQRDNPLYQVINQLIDFLRNSIDATALQLGDLQQCCDNTKIPPKNVSNAPFPLPFESGESYSDYNPIGYIPGPRGPQGPQGVAGSGSSYFWVEYEEDSPELPALMTLLNVGSIPESSIADGTILARVAANEIITGQWDFTGTPIRLVRVNPELRLRDTGAAADEGNWSFTNVGGVFSFSAQNDAISVTNNALIFTRSGASITGARIQTGAGVLRTIWDSNGILDHRYALMLSGTTSVSLSADQTAWNPSGLGTAYLIDVVPTVAGWTIRGITAQSAGYTFAIFNNSSNTINLSSEDGAASAANRLKIPAAYTILTNEGCIFMYDGNVSRWIILGKT